MFMEKAISFIYQQILLQYTERVWENALGRYPVSHLSNVRQWNAEGNINSTYNNKGSSNTWCVTVQVNILWRETFFVSCATLVPVVNLASRFWSKPWHCLIKSKQWTGRHETQSETQWTKWAPVRIQQGNLPSENRFADVDALPIKNPGIQTRVSFSLDSFSGEKGNERESRGIISQQQQTQ